MIEQDYEPEPVPACQPTLNEIPPPASFKPEMVPAEPLLSQEPTIPHQAHWNVDLPVTRISLETALHVLRALRDDEEEVDDEVESIFLEPRIPLPEAVKLHEPIKPLEAAWAREPSQFQKPPTSSSLLKTRSM